MKEEKTITIGNETFEFSNNIRTEARYSNIHEAYARPSSLKVAIWVDWCKWLMNVSEDCKNDYLAIGSATGFISKQKQIVKR